MAKQTFTTGQVLTAAQMTSLQQTAMGGGSATAKTASYVLVAADAGTTVAMNAAGATTITVNTGLFAAGDTVFIQNLGAGACTVTAGTATVATAGSLILPQNDAGILYFTATGAAIFYDYIQAGAVSPLTTKGDLYGFSTSDARIPIGTNNQVLTADSAEALGLKWATPASGGGMTLLETLTMSGSSVTSSTIPGTYTNLFINGVGLYSGAAGGNTMDRRFNGDTGSNYSRIFMYANNSTVSVAQDNNNSSVSSTNFATTNDYLTAMHFTQTITRYSDATHYKDMVTFFRSNTNEKAVFFDRWNSTAAITSLTFFCASNSFSGGTIYIYGVK